MLLKPLIRSNLSLRSKFYFFSFQCSPLVFIITKYSPPTCSRFLWDLSKQQLDNPQPEVVEEWIQAISREIKIELSYSPRLRGTLVECAHYVHCKSKACKGGRQRKEFLEKDWSFVVERDNVVFGEAVEKENCELKETVVGLKWQLCEKAEYIKRMKAETSTHGRRQSSEEYSKKHRRRMKMERSPVSSLFPG